MADTKKTVTAYIAGDATGYKKAMSEAEGQTGKSGSVMSGIFMGVGMAAANLAVEGVGKVVGFLGDSVGKANEAQVATAKLTTAMRDQGQSYAASSGAIGAFAAAQEKLGFTASETTGSLAKFVTSGLSVKDAMGSMAAAQDLARLKGISLEDATTTIMKAENGRVVGLTSLGIAVEKHATKEQVLAAVERAAGGQAEAYAGTMSGSLAAASAEVAGVQEKLGGVMDDIASAVLPSLVAGLGVVIDWFSQLIAQLQPFVPVVVSLAQEGFAALSDAFTQVLAAVQPLMPVIQKLAGQYIGMMVTAWQTVSKVMTGTVIPIVVSIVKAVLPPLTAALKWLADDIVPSVTRAFEYVASKVFPLVASAVDWVTKNVLPPLGAAFSWIVKNVLPPVTTAFAWVANTVLPALGTGFGILTDRVIPALSNAFQAVGRVIGSVMGAVGGTVKTVVNGVIGGINALIRAIDSVKFSIHIPNPLGGSFDFGFAGVNLRQIPTLHSGGIVPGTPGSDVLAILQAGERVLPRGGAGGGPVINVYIQGGLVDGPTIDSLTNAIARRLKYASGT